VDDKGNITSWPLSFHTLQELHFQVEITKPEGYAKRRAMMLKNVFKDEKFSVDRVEFSNMTCSIGTAEIKGEIEKVKISEITDKLYNELCDRLYQAKASGGDYIVGSPKSSRTA